MSDIRYMISEASKMVDVEAHVLRYWEVELDIAIPRNEMGHRYYREADIELLKLVKQLKNQGFQLKALKIILSNMHNLDADDGELLLNLKEEFEGKIMNIDDYTNTSNTSTSNLNTSNPDTGSIGTSGQAGLIKDAEIIDTNPINKMDQFKEFMGEIIGQAIRQNNAYLSQEICENLNDKLVKELDYNIGLHEKREEERYRKLDLALREYQKARMMTAITNEGKSKKQSKFFRKNNIKI